MASHALHCCTWELSRRGCRRYGWRSNIPLPCRSAGRTRSPRPSLRARRAKSITTVLSPDSTRLLRLCQAARDAQTAEAPRKPAWNTSEPDRERGSRVGVDFRERQWNQPARVGWIRDADDPVADDCAVRLSQKRRTEIQARSRIAATGARD